MKLVKSSYDRMISGVCGGLGNYLGVDATLIRIAFAVAAVLGVGAPVLIYLVMAIVMPREDIY